MILLYFTVRSKSFVWHGPGFGAIYGHPAVVDGPLPYSAIAIDYAPAVWDDGRQQCGAFLWLVVHHVYSRGVGASWLLKRRYGAAVGSDGPVVAVPQPSLPSSSTTPGFGGCRAFVASSVQVEPNGSVSPSSPHTRLTS